MPLATANIPIGATYTPAGGTATAFSSLGYSSDGVHKLFIDDGVSLILRKNVIVTTRAPVVSVGAPNGYTQQRVNVYMKFPKLLANGNYTVNTLRVDMSYDSESSAADVALMREMLTHLGVDADFDGLYEDASPA